MIGRLLMFLLLCASKEGRSYLLELDERQVVPFDTMKNQFPATGDNCYLLTTTAAEVDYR